MERCHRARGLAKGVVESIPWEGVSRGMRSEEVIEEVVFLEESSEVEWRVREERRGVKFFSHGFMDTFYESVSFEKAGPKD